MNIKTAKPRQKIVLSSNHRASLRKSRQNNNNRSNQIVNNTFINIYGAKKYA